ncbi:helix-turn-helix transcriptional regulator [Aerococcaceae bacterium zg-ZJ1578]|uniref:helix-turn-helix domain-containing protein n=1 Tax=Aerococcaceae bacterium zg-252 TaxID=2796928 RepID=UPI001A24EBB8|nr:helix-turn-helix transcriptional regulator [Aerococcaceae bacterium zg-1578]
MKLSYNKLRLLMIDNEMKGADLIRAAALTPYAWKKISKNESISVEMLMRVCKVFHCDIGDLVEVLLDE